MNWFVVKNWTLFIVISLLEDISIIYGPKSLKVSVLHHTVFCISSFCSTDEQNRKPDVKMAKLVMTDKHETVPSLKGY